MKTCQVIATLFSLLFAGAGCMTNYCITQKAQAHVTYDPQTDKTIEVPNHPGYYFFIPFTVAGDIVTSPFQLWLHANGDSMISPGGYYPPVPIPGRDAFPLPKP